MRISQNITGWELIPKKEGFLPVLKVDTCEREGI
jgi:hypothetical protein